jgi:outer membrane receptor for ferrienterochelin and colicin
MKLSRFSAVLAAVLLIGISMVMAQTTASLTGTVTLGGAALPGVAVTISSPNLQGARTTTTDINGNYNFGGLPPGDYTVRFDMESMQSVTRTVKVGLSQTSRQNADMKLTAVAESITVTASAPAVLETTQVQTNISAKLIEDLPIARTLIGTVNLAPGVSQNGPGGNTMISGGYAYDSTYYVDGAVVNELLRGQPQNLFIEDAIQETTVQTGAISAEYGRFTGGVVTAVSKSGGNEYSGSLRDSLTNPVWTTRGDLDTGTRPASKLQSQYEATLGGRIIRDRLWFFAAGRQFNRDLQNLFAKTTPTEPTMTWPFSDHERRLEGKLTGQLTPKHTLVGSYFTIDRKQKNNCSFGCLEAIQLDASRSLPNNFTSFDYNGIITNNFLIEGTYARQIFKFVDSGADAPADFAHGTDIAFQALSGAPHGGYPVFCGGCDPAPESRNNFNGKLKGSYFLSTKGTGTHNLTFGGEDYQDMLHADNSQSASGYTIFAFERPTRAADGTLLFNGGGAGTITTRFVYWPVLQHTKANKFNTKSVFANDKWDMNNHLNFNLGVRYDNNEGTNQAGAKVASDSKISPRLGLIYDVFGNGRLRANASYSQYASKIANGNIGDATSTAGVGSYLYYLYYGPAIVNQPTPVALQIISDWFTSVGGLKNTDFLIGGGTKGISSLLKGKLTSPGMNEYTVGLGGQIGTNGFLRADYQNRKWNNFYDTFANTTTGKVLDPIVPADFGPIDIQLTGNSDFFTRKYQAVLVQGGYRLFTRFNLGGNYTYAKLRGNITGETGGSGPVPAFGPQYYPEFLNYPNANPIGFLGADQRHKARGWITYDMPTFLGNFNFSVLERFDSGTPYSAAGSVYVSNGSGSRCTAAALANTGFNPCPSNATTQYTNIFGSSTNTYFFGQRGQFRTDNLVATDLAVNYHLPISKAQLFVEGELINAFNHQAATNVNTQILTATTSACVQTTGAGIGKRCYAFNPFTDTPVEGVNWVKGVNFGKPVNPTSASTAGDFQTPRTYRVSVGVKF